MNASPTSGKRARGRFAPSPSGRMHLGNVYTAVMSWLGVKSKGGDWVLRIEDLDRQRSRLEYARLIEDDLHWLGLDWDEGGLDNLGNYGPYSQSLRSDIYEGVLGRLTATGLTYPCRCTRAEIMATQAPHQSDGRVVYGGHCRPAEPRTFTPEEWAGAAVRITVPDVAIAFDDAVAGSQRFNLAHDCGDFVLRRSDGAWAYQLAVVADDALMGITEVVRGDDLLLSAAQQIFLFGLLGYAPPAYAHVPLVRNDKGQRLSKRDKSMGMEQLRLDNSPERLLGTVGALAGIVDRPRPLTLDNLLEIYCGRLQNIL